MSQSSHPTLCSPAADAVVNSPRKEVYGDTKCSVIWVITPCNPLKVNRHFGGTCYLHRQGRRISQEKQRESKWQTVPGCYNRDLIGAVEESPLLEAVTKKRLLKRQSEKSRRVL
jgi:hypothetical protein